MLTGTIVAINAGSSSLKIAAYAPQGDVLIRCGVKSQGSREVFEAKTPSGELMCSEEWPRENDRWPRILKFLEANLPAISAIGHRVVHGGQRFISPVRIDAEIMQALQALSELAPLHQPQSLAAIDEIARHRPLVPQIACFDTAFHANMPLSATQFSIPRALHESGVRRYGFHGLSYEFIAGRLRDVAPALSRVIVAHLGSGASLCALRDGRSVDTTMGLTPLDGLMMGTRCGSIDPGILLFLMQARRMSAEKIAELLYHESGLLGVSGISGDMQILSASSEKTAAEAVDLFIHQLVRQLGAMAASLGGVDCIVFTGGIGAHMPAIRKETCRRLAWLGIALDDSRNATDGDACITIPQSRVCVWKMATDEEVIIARHSLAVLGSNGAL